MPAARGAHASEAAWMALALFVAYPNLRNTYSLPQVRLVLDTAVTLAAAIVALLAGLRFSVDGRRLELTPQRSIRWHACEAEALGERVDVKHRAAFDNRRLAAGHDVVDGDARAVHVLRRIEGELRIDEVDHVVTDYLPLLGRRLVGRDVEHLVDLPRVGDDDLAAQPLRELECDRRLADARRPDDDDDGSCGQ